MTYKNFSEQDRITALLKLGNIIEHNLYVTSKAIEYCGENNWNYRLSSSIFPLITYDLARVNLIDLPNYESITLKISEVREMHYKYPAVRLSLHPDQFNVLASENKKAVERTINELEFYAAFMTDIGCAENQDCPINIHVNRNGNFKEIADAFMFNFEYMAHAARSRLVLENDDKAGGWGVVDLYDHFYSKYHIPITFDYLHHKCHPGKDDSMRSEEEAFYIAYSTWRKKPLFHYSESVYGDPNPRKHAEYAIALPNTYGKDIDLDFEFKAKEKSFAHL